MKKIATLTRNHLAIIDNGKLKPSSELILVLAEPQYRVDMGGGIIRERSTETVRFAACPQAMREIADHLNRYADELEEEFDTSIRKHDED